VLIFLTGQEEIEEMAAVIPKLNRVINIIYLFVLSKTVYFRNFLVLQLTSFPCMQPFLRSNKFRLSDQALMEEEKLFLRPTLQKLLLQSLASGTL
jgi:hypothetical protein